MWWLLACVAAAAFTILHAVGGGWRRRLSPRGRAVLVTGCDTGIGRRLAQHLAELGFTVIEACLHKPADDAPEKEGTFRVQLDVTNQRSVDNAVAWVKANVCQELWAVINNAGVLICGEFEWLTNEQIQHQVEVNVLGTLRCTKAFLPLLRKSKGRIINVTSINSKVGFPGFALYGATKAALESFSETFRMEVRKFGMEVVTVRPGDFARLTAIMASQKYHMTRMWEAMDKETRAVYGSYFQRFMDFLLENYGLTSPPNFEKSTLLSVFEDALLDPCPRLSYTSAPLAIHFLTCLVALLPRRWMDKLLLFFFSKSFGFDYRNGRAENDKEI